MKQSLLPKFLLVALAVVAVLSVFWCYSAVRNGAELRDYQTKLNIINQRQAVLNALAVDLLEYSKTHPAIDPLLESVGIKQGKASPAPTPSISAPSVKTPSK